MPDQLPPVGSLWRHKDGERRNVQIVNDMPSHECVGFNDQEHMDIYRRLATSWCTLADWLAWQADAVRIDREEA